jgi:hypothetical protein
MAHKREADFQVGKSGCGPASQSLWQLFEQQ